MKKLLFLTLLLFCSIVNAKTIGKNGSTTYIDMDGGFVEYANSLGFPTIYGCFARRDANGNPVVEGAICANNIPGTSIFTFSTSQLLSNFGVSPWQSASLLVVIAGKRTGDVNYTLYQPMKDYVFNPGLGSGFSINNTMNYVNFWYEGARPR
jgi:hypothetical protein